MRATSGVAPSRSSCPVVIRASTAPIAKPMSATTGSVSRPACWRWCGKRVRSRRVRPSSMRTQESTVEPKKSSLPPSERNEWMVHQPTLSVHGSGPRAARRLSRGDRSSSARCAPPPRTAPCRASSSSCRGLFRQARRVESDRRAPSRNRESWPGTPARLVSQRSTAAASRRRLRGGGDASRACVTSPTGRRPSRRLQVPDKRTTAASPSRETDTVVGAATFIRSGQPERERPAAGMISQTSLPQRPPPPTGVDSRANPRGSP